LYKLAQRFIERTSIMPSQVTAVPPAAAPEALAHFEAALRFETDCWDVHDAMSRGAPDFVLLDVRSPALYRAESWILPLEEPAR
jgi:hypothetical protein